MGSTSAKNSFGQTLGALLLILAIVFVFGYFIVRHQLEKRDIDVAREVESAKAALAEKAASLKSSGENLLDAGEKRAEELKVEAAAALPDGDDFEGANNEAEEFFAD